MVIYLKVKSLSIYTHIWRYLMNDNMRWILVLFFIVVVVNIIPSFAVQMEQVADDAKDYNDESHKKMGFFGKIKFTVRGFHLIAEAKNAEKDSKKDDKQKTPIRCKYL